MKYEVLKIKSLEHAENEIKKINVNPTGVKIMALKAISLFVKFENVETKTANLIKQEMLSRGGDVAVSKDAGSFEVPTTDIIIIGNLAQFVRLVRKMKIQTAFKCKELTESIEQLLNNDFEIDIEEVAVW